MIQTREMPRQKPESFAWGVALFKCYLSYKCIRVVTQELMKQREFMPRYYKFEAISENRKAVKNILRNMVLTDMVALGEHLMFDKLDPTVVGHHIMVTAVAGIPRLTGVGEGYPIVHGCSDFLMLAFRVYFWAKKRDRKALAKSMMLLCLMTIILRVSACAKSLKDIILAEKDNDITKNERPVAWFIAASTLMFAYQVDIPWIQWCGKRILQ